MKIDPESLNELKRISTEQLHRDLSDSEAQDIGQRIVRFLIHYRRLYPGQLRDIDAP